MKSEGFWHIEYNEQANQGQPKSVKQINKRIKRVYLDPSVISFFKDEQIRKELINTLLNAGYFSNEEIASLTQKIKEIDDSFVYQEKLQQLVDNAFRERPLIDYTGLPPSRNPAFRRLILETYNETCAICRMKLENSLGISVIDAAHILPFSQFHNDDVRNGLSLCKLHHWLFDHGLITVNTDYTIQVSKKIDYEYPKKLVSTFHNKQILFPKQEKNLPSPVALRWHKNNVFD
jgi:putative restriction endonuclease